MDENKELRGYVEYNNKQYPFLYKDGLLDLFPPTVKEWRAELAKQFREFGKFDSSMYKNEWIKKYKLNAILNNHKKAIFIVQEDYSCDNGFIQFCVDVAYVYDGSDIDKDLIDSIVLNGTEINDFFNPRQVFNIDLNRDNEDLVTDIIVKSKVIKVASGGSYKIDDKIQATLEFKATPSMNLKKSIPIESRSNLQINFSESVNIDTALICIEHMTKLFMYLCYRSNISFDSIKVLSSTSEVLRRSGEIILNQGKYGEEDTKRKDKIITYELLNENIGDILQEIADDKLYFEHICSSIKDTTTYAMNRIILIFAAFEREYRNIYGQKVERSEEYNSAKKSVLEAISILKDENTGKRKKYINSFYRMIDRSDNTLSEKLTKSIKDCIEIIEPFIKYIYGEYDEELVEDIGSRMNVIRNDIAHGNLSLEIEPINLNDFKVIQILLYVMRLNHIGIGKSEIIKSINGLFLYRISTDLNN